MFSGLEILRNQNIRYIHEPWDSRQGSSLLHPGSNDVKKILKASLLILAMLIGLGSVLSHDARAGTPSSGTISQIVPGITWQGQFFAFGTSAAPQQCPPNLDPLNLQCDHFFLTLDLPSDFWLTHSGTVTVTIQWTDGSNDFDLYVYRESDGAQVGASTLGGGETAETVILLNPLPGAYEVRVT